MFNNLHVSFQEREGDDNYLYSVYMDKQKVFTVSVRRGCTKPNKWSYGIDSRNLKGVESIHSFTQADYDSHEEAFSGALTSLVKHVDKVQLSQSK